MAYDEVLRAAQRLAAGYLNTLAERPVIGRETDPVVEPADLPTKGADPVAALTALAQIIDRAGVATAGPRYFGFVTGGTLPAAMAADWLASAWDQNAALYVMSPAMAAIEDRVAAWVLDLLRLPPSASVGFVTGATMANMTCLAAARDEVLRRSGWDVEQDGLQAAPRLTVVVGAEAHSSIYSASRVLGFGTAPLLRVDADGQGRMMPASLARVLSGVTGPCIVCLQAGHVNTGAFDPFTDLIEIAHGRGAWVHVDGAFGLWARTVDRLGALTGGLERADSWAVDAHKWLNVPYDSGLAIVAHPAAHRASMAQNASYLIRGASPRLPPHRRRSRGPHNPASAPAGERRDGMDWTPEASRRARAVPIYAALLTLGRDGVAELVDRCCRLAERMAGRLRGQPGVEILNDVVLNQVLVRFRDADGRNVMADAIARVQQGGVCWVGGTAWRGEPAMRISVSNWSTTDADIDASADALLEALQ